MPRPPQTRYFVRNAVTTPLGQLVSGGILRDSPGVPPHPMRVFGRYALVYVLDGGGLYEDSNGYRRTVTPGDLICVFPELAHSYRPFPGGHWDEFHVTFDGPVFDFWRARGYLDDAQPVLRLEPIEPWLGRFLAFADNPLPVTETGKAQEVCRFLSLLTDIAATRSPAPSGERLWLEQAVRLLESDLSDELDLPSVAAQVGMSYETFRKQFAQQIGIGPARYRTTRRVDVARELLTHTRMTNRQIADSLGFADEFHFSKRFKQITGQTPRRYRQPLSEGTRVGSERALPRGVNNAGSDRGEM